MAARRGRGGVEEGCPALSLATAEFAAAGAEKPIDRRVVGRFLELFMRYVISLMLPVTARTSGSATPGWDWKTRFSSKPPPTTIGNNCPSRISFFCSQFGRPSECRPFVRLSPSHYHSNGESGRLSKALASLSPNRVHCSFQH